jgi:hypothetical protein
MMHNALMRTTVTLKRETHAYVRYYARARGLTLGAALDELIQNAQAATPAAVPEIQFLPNGLPIFPPTGRTITSEEIKQLEAEEYEPK